MARSRRHWFVAHCRASQEPAAQDNLLRQGFGVYLPLVWVTRRSVIVPEPLFPCYLFVRFDPVKKSAASIRSTRGVIGLVKFGDVSAVVPDEVVAVLKVLEDEDGVHAGRTRMYAEGDMVRLTSGPFEGMLAKVAEQDRGGRIVVLMEILSRVNRFSVPRELVAYA